MNDFINYVVGFINDLYNAFYDACINYNFDIDTLLEKSIFNDSSLIGINLTYGELITSVFSFVVVILIIVLFITMIKKMFSLFKLW